MTDSLKLRTCTADDLSALASLISGAFLGDVEEDELEIHRMMFEPERTYVLADTSLDDRFVATGGATTRDLTVPGGAVPTTHVTAIAVAATHRRRGLLTQIMTALLTDARTSTSEPIAALWATEGGIYGRYGFGLASWNTRYAIARNETAVAGHEPGPNVRLREAVPAEARDVLADVFDRAGDRPGLSSRPGRLWEARTADPKSQRNGQTAERVVLYEAGDRVDGYAMWRTSGDWGSTGPNGNVFVTEIVASTDAAYAGLWRFLLSIDLTRTVHVRHAAADEALPHLLTNAGALGMTSAPGLWVRILNVPEALANRRYQSSVDTILEVKDALLPDNQGRWRLRGDRTTASCEPTTDAPDLSLDVRELGAAYLGGTSLAALGAAGQVTEHRPGALDTASAAFGWYRYPLSKEVF